MTRRKKVSQRPLEENRKARNRARKPAVVRRAPVHQLARRPHDNGPGAANPEHIKGLQQTVGNRVVTRLLSTAGQGGMPAVQRQPVTPASEEKELVAGSSTKMASTVPSPGPSGVPTPYPNASPATQAPSGASKVLVPSKGAMVGPGSQMGSSMGDEAGTMKGIPSASVSSNMPGPITVATPSQAAVTVEGEGAQPTQTPAPQPEEQASP